ncbi:hypothetical protein [Clostridium cochlearium]|uniref:hypothetical protein n=1 Tax=Clostridium cochlearium TaxID=1494 RepID=UPI00183BAAEA|nr:hypothetical protein [Clostridium cochlearium]NMA58634.1 hypothetical protein [Clostridium cochlearium]
MGKELIMCIPTEISDKSKITMKIYCTRNLRKDSFDKLKTLNENILKLLGFDNIFNLINAGKRNKPLISFIKRNQNDLVVISDYMKEISRDFNTAKLLKDTMIYLSKDLLCYDNYILSKEVILNYA